LTPEYYRNFFGEMPRAQELTEIDKWRIISRYNLELYPGEHKLRRGIRKQLSLELGVKPNMLTNLAQNYRNQVNANGYMNVSLAPMKKGRVGRKNGLTNALRRRIHRKNTVTKGRLPIRTMALQLGIGRNRLFRYMKIMSNRYKRSWLRPKLTEDQRMQRIRFITKLRNGPRSMEFKDQLNTIVVDESWFYLYKDRKLVRLFPGDQMFASDKVQHKSHIPKIMFLTALARPQPERGFNGKIGIWRIQEEKICEKTNRYHRAGDVYVHDCTLNAALYQQFMMKVFKKIKEKMPWMRGQEVIVQQDGAPSHKGRGNLDYFHREGQKHGWNIKVITQPAQSPDLNINDLAFFRSFKCRVENVKDGANDLDSLYRAVLRAWNNYDSETLHRIWGVQYACYRKILELNGDNEYQVPHSGIRKGADLIDLSLDLEVFRQARNLLNDYEGR
jgi:hypothetical protein